MIELLALVRPAEFVFLPPICLAIALVTSASHREDLGEILRHAVVNWIKLMVGIGIFALALTILLGWVLPG
jgi:hypothetical protein